MYLKSKKYVSVNTKLRGTHTNKWKYLDQEPTLKYTKQNAKQVERWGKKTSL